MKTAVVAVMLFALFIALVEWRRHYADSGLSRGLDTRVTAERARRAISHASSKGHDSPSSSAPLSVSAPSEPNEPDAGAPSTQENTDRPRDADADRRKAVAAMDAIQRLMDAEHRDEAWAPAVEAWTRANYGKRPGSHLEHVECKRTLCAAGGTHDTEQVYAAWVSRFTGRDRGLRVMTMPEVLPSGKTHARTFILRDDQPAPSKAR